MLVVDLGGQYSQLIARRVREARVYSELVSHRSTVDEIRRRNPIALILSGGPASVYADGAPKIDPAIFELGDPDARHLLRRAAARARARRPRRPDRRLASSARTEMTASTAAGSSRRCRPSRRSWMSHRDTVVAPPDGARVVADVRAHAGRRVRRRGAAALRRAVPPRGRAHAARPGRAEELPLRGRGRRARRGRRPR